MVSEVEGGEGAIEHFALPLSMFVHIDRPCNGLDTFYLAMET